MDNSKFIYQNQDGFLSIIVTTSCNYRCPYCVLEKNTGIDLDIKYDDNFNIKNLNLLDNYDFDKLIKVNILGGEPGLLSRKDLDSIFNYFKNKNVPNSKIRILTNGLFLEKYLNYYKDFNYAYHVIDFNSFKDYSKYNLKLYNLYVIWNEESIDEFEKILKFYSNIKFEMDFDINLNLKNVSDEFFNKLKYLVNNYNNIIIMNNTGFSEKIKNEMFSNKKKFNIINSLFVKKELYVYSNFNN
jgi:MoaA/NifB/PqqE/SkfB family radical SAM enzyme